MACLVGGTDLVHVSLDDTISYLDEVGEGADLLLDGAK